MSFEPWYEMRNSLVAALQRDLVGPSEAEEIISDYPLERYVAGVLFPRRGREVDPAQDGDVSSEDPDGETTGDDAPVSMAHVKYPSSMGLTFAVAPSVERFLTVHTSAARYEEVPPPTGEEPPYGEEAVRRQGHEGDDDGREELEGDAGPAHARFRRVPLNLPPQVVDVTVPTHGRTIRLADGLSLFIRIRPVREDAGITVTLALVNEHRIERGFRDEWSFFQPEIRVTGSDGKTFPFLDRWRHEAERQDEDLQSLDLLYRDRRHYATGHGCSVTWPESTDPSEGIRTTFVPMVELRLAESNLEIPSDALGMRWLGSVEVGEAVRGLRGLADSYDDWIAKQEEAISSLEGEDLRATARRHISDCRRSSARIRRGIDLLQGDEQVWRAFRLANRAMLKQRSRADWLSRGRPPEGPEDSDRHQWRPFQVAFFLQCLEGLANPASDDRRLADLLWFPTGGGKTEAYLGLIAFTIFHRRLSQPDRAGGVVALMRYTLRLLTIQQFQRASMLICACEAIRRNDPTLGSTPISIGLWVGGRGTPNRLSDAGRALRRLSRGAVLSEGDPVQLHVCPWCGAVLSARNYVLRRTEGRLVISCEDERCEFRSGLPVYVVDEEIYRDRPTLLIGTVDKFASMAWKEEVHRLFNLDSDDLPPELIVQDELHLISGPLGTMTALYETAIDAVCSRAGAPPKIIASTATIRRAGPQGWGLFNRSVRQFPSPGLSASDSFFAVEASPRSKPTRRYIGVMAPGTSHATLMIRVYAALLQTATELEARDDVRDPYWTLVGYFNSLRVLGGARLAVSDDVPHRIELLAQATDSSARRVERVIELTSREPSSEIPHHLEAMADRYPSEDALDVILATNMISVGVDIDRLGLMAVMGQPQATSEYIQATSRIGRKWAGLVVTVLNAARSRDRSHFEGFVPFHRAIYRGVEATSVTPFAPRARDRALHAVFVALVRLLIPEMRPNDGAGRIERHLERVKEVERLILDRVREVDPSELEYVQKQLSEIREHWRRRAEATSLIYANESDPARALLVEAGDPGREAFPTLRSMRDVDQASNLYQIG